MAKESDIDPDQPGGISLQGDILSPGEKFGDYQVMDCLSFDLLGGVYRMQHIFKFHEVCILVLPKAAAEQEGFEERFEKHAKILSLLDHPNILKVESHEVIDGRYCLIMESADGENLSEYLDDFAEKQQKAAGAGLLLAPPKKDKDDEDGPKTETTLRDHAFGLPMKEVTEIFKQTAGAFQAAHNAEMHHSLFNPTSLIRLSDGSVKVTGFGLYEMVGKELFDKLVQVQVPPIKIGPRTVVVNTAATLAPEVLKGKEVNKRSDLYSLGLTGYFLLTGQTPGKIYKDPSELSAAIPEGWDEVVRRCLEAKPGRRYEDAKTLISEINRIERASTVTEEEKSLARQIARIPIPKSLEERLDPKTVQYLRLGILGVFAAIVIGIASLSYSIIFQDDGGGSGPAVRRAVPPRGPDVVLKIRPETSKVVFSGRGQSNFVVTTGELGVLLPRGNYDVRVEAADYLPKTFELVKEKEEQVIPVNLSPSYANLEVKALPGTRVTAIRKKHDPVLVGVVPASGVLVADDKIYTDTYDLEFSRPHYEPLLVEKVVLPRGQVVTQEVQLTPLPGRVRVLTDPAGAGVYLDRKLVGSSPHILEDLPVGEPIRISVALDKYRPQERLVTLQAGFDGDLDFGALERKAGTVIANVTFSGEPPTPAQIKDIEYHVAEMTVKGFVGPVEKVDMGRQVFEVRHPDYQLWSQEIRMEDGGTIALNIDLQPRPGLLTVNLDKKAEFTVHANGKQVPGKGNVFDIPPGDEVSVEVRILNHLTAQRTMSFTPNQKKSWDITAVPIPGPEEDEEWYVPYVGVDMAWVDAGTFTMGSPPVEQARLPTEGPQTSVTLTHGFWMGKYEVKQSEFMTVMKMNPSEFTDSSKPVDRVHWEQAAEFCRKVTQQEREAGRLPKGYVYRLPTEAEWEYAARAGTDTPFYFGDRADPSNGNFKSGYPREYADSLSDDSGIYGTRKVGQYEPNAWGFYDMAGNVREWAQDRFNSRYPGGSVSDPAGPATGTDRVSRGGGWEDFAHQCRSASRQRFNPIVESNSQGFRLVLAPEVSP